MSRKLGISEVIRSVSRGPMTQSTRGTIQPHPKLMNFSHGEDVDELQYSTSLADQTDATYARHLGTVFCKLAQVVALTCLA